MAKCQACGREDRLIAGVLSACADCIRRGDEAFLERLDAAHAVHRRQFGLPEHPPPRPCRP